jgi:hypothetical protein
MRRRRRRRLVGIDNGQLRSEKQLPSQTLERTGVEAIAGSRDGQQLSFRLLDATIQPSRMARGLAHGAPLQMQGGFELLTQGGLARVFRGDSNDDLQLADDRLAAKISQQIGKLVRGSRPRHQDAQCAFVTEGLELRSDLLALVRIWLGRLHGSNETTNLDAGLLDPLHR